MIDFLEKARCYLWLFVEIGFLAVLAIGLIYLILGDNSGSFVTSVVDNVLDVANDIPEKGLVGIALVLALVILLSNRIRA